MVNLVKGAVMTTEDDRETITRRWRVETAGPEDFPARSALRETSTDPRSHCGASRRTGRCLRRRPDRRFIIRPLIAVVVIVLAACGSDSTIDVGDGGGSTDGDTVLPDEPDSTIAGDEPSSGSPTTAYDPVTADEPTGAGARPCAEDLDGGPDALAIRVCQVEPEGGDEATVAVRVRASDRDARVRDDCGSPVIAWGDGRDTVMCEILCMVTDPPPSGSSIDHTSTHTFTDDEPREITVTVESGCGELPSGERKTIRLPIG